MAEMSLGVKTNKHEKMICWLSASLLLGERFWLELAVKSKELAADLVCDY